MRRFCAVSVVASLVTFHPAMANDTTAQLATGGLIFVHNEHVELRSEDLFISAAEVKVRYRFFNKTDRDVKVLVAFPMPEIKAEQEVAIALPSDDPINALDFSTLVDGVPVKTQIEQRVIAAGIDRTKYLQELGLPLAPHLGTTNDALDRLPRERWDELIRLGLAEVEEYDIGKGMQQHLSARWALQTTFYWEQVFPAGAETLIEHRYKPSVGGTAGTGLGSKDAERESWFGDYVRKYCLDKAFLTAVSRAKQAAKAEFGAPFTEERIDYILKTGANWSGPIGQFRLVVDKGHPDNLVSFCAQGVRKIGSTQFEWVKKDFRPEGSLSILFLRRFDLQ